MLNGIKISHQYILIGLLIFLSTSTSVLSRSVPVLFLSTVAVTFYFVYNNFKFDKLYSQILIFFVILTLIYYIQFNNLSPLFIGRLFAMVTLSYLIVKMTRLNFFPIIEDIIYWLALISLPLYLIQLVAFDQLFYLNGLMERIHPVFEFGGESNTNSFIFTLKTYAINRNSGFMWEPGAFAAMLSLPIFINLISNDFRFNKKLLILVTAMVTTISTMGFMILILIGLFVIYNSNKQYAFISAIITLPVIIYMFNLGFMSEKIEKEYANIDNVIDIAFTEAGSKKETMSLGRLASLKFDFNDFLKYPIVGVGGNDSALSTSSVYKLNRTNGWGRHLRTFGLLGFILFFYHLSKSGKKLMKQFKFKGVFFFVLIILCFTFSNGIIMLPYLISVHLYHYYT